MKTEYALGSAHTAAIKHRQEPEMFDHQVAVDQSIFGLTSAMQELSDALDDERKAEYLEGIRNQAILNSSLTKLILICSVLRERSRLRTLDAAE